MIELNKKEEIQTIKRKHILILILELIPLALFGLVLVVAMVLLPFAFEDPDWMSDLYNYFGQFNSLYFIYFLISLLFFLLWNIAFLLFSVYYLDCWIVTDQRTIHTELKGLFNRYISSIYHHRIQDVSVDVGGVLPTYFNFGDLQIQTAGNFREFIFKKIPEPYETKSVVMEAQKKFLKMKKRSKTKFNEKNDDF